MIHNSLLLVIDRSEGAKAMLDHDPAITPITKEKANQYNEEPPHIKSLVLEFLQKDSGQ